MANLTLLPTLTLVEMLENEYINNHTSENVYLYIREIALRQAHRQHWGLDYLQFKELVDTVATNIWLKIQSKYGTEFRIINWLKYIYNKVYKTSLAMFYGGADIQPQVFTITDCSQEDDFLERYFYNQVHQYYELDQIDTDSCVEYIYRYLYDCIGYYLKYNDTYPQYETVFNSILFSIVFNRPIHLYGLDRKDIHYVDTITKIIIIKFDDYLRENFVIDGSKHSDMTNKLIDYLQYERLQDVYDKA